MANTNTGTMLCELAQLLIYHNFLLCLFSKPGISDTICDRKWHVVAIWPYHWVWTQSLLVLDITPCSGKLSLLVLDITPCFGKLSLPYLDKHISFSKWIRIWWIFLLQSKYYFIFTYTCVESCNAICQYQKSCKSSAKLLRNSMIWISTSWLNVGMYYCEKMILGVSNAYWSSPCYFYCNAF